MKYDHPKDREWAEARNFVKKLGTITNKLDNLIKNEMYIIEDLDLRTIVEITRTLKQIQDRYSRK